MLLFHAELEPERGRGAARRCRSPRRTAVRAGTASSYEHESLAGADAIAAAAQRRGRRDDRGAGGREQRVVSEHEKLGRNDPCWCGSGKKYKKCHGA